MKIRLVVVDVDGTLTDGGIYKGDSGDEYKKYNAKDGLCIINAQKIGFDFMVLSSSKCESIKKRAEHLKIKYVFLDVEDKKSFLLDMIKKYNYSLDEIAYIGDDLNDYATMGLCMFKACPADAVLEIRDICDYVSPFNGGHGAVRDICEYIFKQEGKYSEFLNLFSIRGSKL